MSSEGEVHLFGPGPSDPMHPMRRLTTVTRLVALWLSVSLAVPNSVLALRATGLEESPEREKLAGALLGNQPEPIDHQGLVAAREGLPRGIVSGPTTLPTAGLEDTVIAVAIAVGLVAGGILWHYLLRQRRMKRGA